MNILMIFLANQIFTNIENKQVFYPEPVMAETTHSYNVLHYLINLNLPMTSRYLEGAVTISMRSSVNNLTEIDLYLLGLNVDSIKVDGISATYNHIAETLYVNLPHAYNQGDSFSVMVGYNGTPTGTMNMGYVFYFSYRTISYTLGCPFATKRWMPCYDYLWDKADYGVEFFITVPDSFTVCANGQFRGKTVSQGRATYHWEHRYPIYPDVIHFSSSIFYTYSDWYHPSPIDSIEVKYFCWPQDTHVARIAFSLTTDMLYFYDSLFGDYPFERYGMDVLYPFYYGGMEHQTNASIHRQIITSADYYTIAHEMSHMWWGDMVTCLGWANVWLNEGFATYSDALYKEWREGHTPFINEMITRRESYFGAEQSNPHPLYNPPPNLIFTWGHSYCKGSWVLHMIRYLCQNDTTWLNLMATYRDSFAYKNASTDDLNRIMNLVLGSNYNWFFQEWVYNMGYPVYNLVWGKNYEPPNWRLILDITQTQTIGPAVFHMPLPIGVNYASGDTIITLAINSSPQHLEFLLPQEPTGVVVDPETWIIQKNTVASILETVVPRPAQFKNIQTIGRSIEMKLNKPSLIKIYDIIGRKIYESFTRELKYEPSNAGIYHIIIGNTKHRIVVVK